MSFLSSIFSGRNKLTFKYLHPLNPELHKEIIDFRDVLVNEVVDDLLMGTPVIISAPRLSGKTTFLFLVSHAVSDRASDFTPVFIDLQGIEPDSTSGVAQEILIAMREMAAQLEDGDRISIPEESDLQVVLEALLAGSFGRLVLLFDGFDAISPETAVQTMKLLKAAINRTVLKHGEVACPFVIAGAVDLLFRGQSSALNFAKMLYLEDFSRQDVVGLLSRVGKGVFFDDAMAEIHRLSGGHPQLVQHLAAIAHQLMAKEERKSVDVYDVERAGRRLVEQNDHLFAATFELLSRYGVDPAFLTRISTESIPFTRLKPEILVAEQVGILRSDNGACSLRSPLFGEVLQYWEPEPEPKPTAKS